MLASDGYPAAPITGGEITGAPSDSLVFHAGTQLADGVLRSSGGRVLTVTGLGANLEAARTSAYAGIEQISLAGSHFRRDIAAKAAKDESGK